ncbi:MAG: hypothetical protein RR840_03395 [Clostridium sp.]
MTLSPVVSNTAEETDLIFYNKGAYIATVEAVFTWEGEQIILSSGDIYALQSADLKIYPGVNFVEYAVYVCVFPGFYALKCKGAYAISKPKKCFELTGALWSVQCTEIKCPVANPYPNLNVGLDLTTLPKVPYNTKRSRMSIPTNQDNPPPYEFPDVIVK